jgi:hypothetical protein
MIVLTYHQVDIGRTLSSLADYMTLILYSQPMHQKSKVKISFTAVFRARISIRHNSSKPNSTVH